VVGGGGGVAESRDNGVDGIRRRGGLSNLFVSVTGCHTLNTLPCCCVMRGSASAASGASLKKKRGGGLHQSS
jgi:hypothetical protein